MYATDRRQTDAKLPYRYYWYLVILYFNYFQEMYFVLLPVIAKVIEKKYLNTFKKGNLYFVIEIHFKSNWSNFGFLASVCMLYVYGEINYELTL